MSTNNKQSSRFSTLNIFKPQKPPPLPPKTPQTPTLHSNHSFLSIQTDPTLLSPYSSNSAAASSSSMSINTAPPRSASSSKKPSMFFKFGKKTKTVPQPKEELREDEGISLPWNFEHTIHVNETLVGLPPSWSNRLTQAGFSDEEIIAIQEARRAAGSVSLYRLNTSSTPRVDSPATTYGGERSGSPMSMSSRSTRPASPTTSSIAQPSPRTTSLRRKPPPPLPTHTTTTSQSSLSSGPSSYVSTGPRQRQSSFDSRHTTSSSASYQNDSSMNVNLDDFSFPVPLSDTPNLSTLVQHPPHPPASSRRFVVTNGTPPPPAYASSQFFPSPSDEKNRNLYTREPEHSQHASIASTSMSPPPVQDGEASPSYETAMASEQEDQFNNDTTPRTTKVKRRSKRFSAAPPRLSLSLGTTPLGEDEEDWTKSLLSSIPSAAGGSGFGLIDEDEDKRKTIVSPLRIQKEDKRKTIISPLQPSSSKPNISGLLKTDSTEGQSSRSMPSTPYESEKPPPMGQRSTSGPITPPLQYSQPHEQATPKSSSIPSIILPTLAKRPDSPMWDEIMEFVDQEDSSHQSDDNRRYTDVSYLSAALSDSQSPTIPITPTSPTNKSEYLSAMNTDENVIGRSHNRDSTESRLSTQSMASTSTVTAHTIVKVPPTGVERGVRAMASVLHPAPVRPLVPATIAPATTTPKGPVPTTIEVPLSKPANQQIPQWKLALNERSKNGANMLGKKKPADLLLPPPASSFGYSAVASNLVLSRAAALAAQQQGQRSQHKQGQHSQTQNKMESPQSSHFGSEESESSSASTRQSQPTPTTDDDEYHAEKEHQPTLQLPTIHDSEPRTPGASIMDYYTGEDHVKEDDTVIDGGCESDDGDDEEYEEDAEEEEVEIVHLAPKSIASPKPTNAPSTHKSQSWLTDLLAPIQSYIDDTVDCRDYYMDLQEMAEGESGSVFSARVLDPSGSLKLPPFVRAREAVAFSLSLPSSSDSLVNLKPGATGAVQVAIKSVLLTPSGTTKLLDVQNELELLHSDGWNEHVLNLDALYVDLVDDALWIRMELMERSIADVLALVEHGLMLQERMIARFASDTALALDFLESKSIAHRDVRSDNLLINKEGVVKLADFSNAVRTGPKMKELTEPVGVIFWQSPEMRRGQYSAQKVDVWSLGATVWEMAESEPPFSDGTVAGDRWPSLSQPELFSPAFHDFLRMCSEPEASRPTASKLSKAAFIQNAAGRSVIVHLLSQCMTIEAGLQEAE